jgi:hypothetical protein
VVGPGMQLLAFHAVVSLRGKGRSPRGGRLRLARLGRALVLEEGEACVPVLRQLVGVESAVRIDDAAGEVLTHQPEQRHRAGDC